MDNLVEQHEEAVDRLHQFNARWQGLEGAELIAASVEEFQDSLVMTSSFGSESAVELHMLAQINPSTKVVFLNTLKLFGETLRYRDLLVGQLGLTNVVSMEPAPADIQALDPKGVLWSSNPDLCCSFRKVIPKERALVGIDATITGRKRFQTQTRAKMPFVELVEKPATGAISWVINPLAAWELPQIHAYIEQHNLPSHPLVNEGYISIGCMPCTDRATAENYRAGRWVGRDKEECGIHDTAFTDGDGI